MLREVAAGHGPSDTTPDSDRLEHADEPMPLDESGEASSSSDLTSLLADEEASPALDETEAIEARNRSTWTRASRTSRRLRAGGSFVGACCAHSSSRAGAGSEC